MKFCSGLRSKLKKIYEQSKCSLKTADKLMVTLAILVVVGTMSLVTSYAAEGEGNEEVVANAGGSDISISRFSGLMADAFNTLMSSAYSSTTERGSSGIESVLELIDQKQDDMNLANIGNYLGIRADNQDATHSSNIWSKGNTAASKRMTVESVLGFYSNKSDKAQNSNIIAYIMFGSMLNEMGIDEFRDAQSAADGLRSITGYATYICFILAYSASGIMDKVVEFMNQFNIFTALWNGSIEIAGISDAKFVTDITDIYNNHLKPFRFVIFAFMVMIFVASITVFKSKQMSHAATTQTRFRNLCYRFAIMAIGLPVVGMFYTECMELAYDTIKSTQYCITDYIFSEFMDYESWATKKPHQAFYIKTGGALKDKNMTVQYDSASQSITVLNSSSYTDKPTKDQVFDGGRFVYTVNESVYGNSITGNSSTGNYIDAVFGNTEATYTGYEKILEEDSTSSVSKKDEAYKVCRDLILSYAKSRTVNPDRMNMYYLSDYDRLTRSLPKPDGDTPEEIAKAQSRNQPIIDQILDETAGQRRIWSYLGKCEVISGKDQDHIEYTLSDVEGEQITLKVMQFPLCTRAAGTVSVGSGVKHGVFVETDADTGGGGGWPIMWSTLTPISVTRTGSYAASGSSQNHISFKGEIKDSTVVSDQTGLSGIYTFSFDMSTGGMSPLSLYNFMNTRFDKGSMDVYDPDSVTNAGVGLMHYSVTLPYKGIPEIVQLLYTICILFSIGIIGWVFGISLLMNTIVQTIKAIPMIFKMIVGSIQGFVESLLIVFSIVAEMIVTILLYSWSVEIIDFLIRLVREVVKVIITSFTDIDAESVAIVSGIISMLVILWGTFELIKWRQAITLSIKSLLTHVLNQMFGTSAQMPTGASNGMLKTGAALAAGAFAAHSLAEDGTLDDVVNDMTGSDIGTDVAGKLESGDVMGALSDVKDYAGGVYRGGSATADAEAEMAKQGRSFNAEDGTTPNATQTFTNDQQAELDADEAEAQALEEKGDYAGAEAKRNEIKNKRRAFGEQNFRSAVAWNEAHPDDKIADWGAAQNYEDEQASETDSRSADIAPADIPTLPSKDLDRDGASAYEAARTGNVSGLRSAADKYDANGQSAEDIAEINKAIANDASAETIAAMIDNNKQKNFGDDAQAVIDKMNEAAGRSNTTVTYGSSDNSDGNARMITVSGQASGGAMMYNVTDEGSGAGMQEIRVTDSGGVSSIQNMTQSAQGNFSGSFQTLDMGSAANAGGATYGQIYNNTASLMQANGQTVIGGGGGAGVVSTSEISVAVSGNQMSSMGYTPQVQHYGDTAQNIVQQHVQNYNIPVQTQNGGTTQQSAGSFENVAKTVLVAKAIEGMTDSSST